MGDYYLTWLADVLRDAGLDVTCEPGWETRARSSGGYESGRPWCVMWHHTAGNADGEAEANWECYASSDAPISNMIINHDGSVRVLAAGATNTNGKGGPYQTSKGTIPSDSMNSYAVGIECCNIGNGSQPYSQAVMDTYLAATIAILLHEGLAATDVCTHYVWAPTRKVDPATAGAVQGPWVPRSCTGSGTWMLDDIKDELARRMAGGADVVTPTTRFSLGAIHDEGDPMFIAVKDGVYWIGNGIGRRRLDDNDEADDLIARFQNADNPLRNFQGGQKVTSRSQVAGAKQMDKLGVNVEA